MRPRTQWLDKLLTADHSTASVRRLNLGCGAEYLDGFVSVDFHENVKPDVLHDLQVLPYPFSDEEFDFILASHVLEHLVNPFGTMIELHRILKPRGWLHIKVPHFSRGFTHAEHKAGFDVTFPQYFNPSFTASGYFGVPFRLEYMRLHYMAFFHLLPYLGYGRTTINALRCVSGVVSFVANLSPNLCSRVWCYWVGGFGEIEFLFQRK